MKKWIFTTLLAAALTTGAAAQQKNPMLVNGMKYIGVPYVAHTLDQGEAEELVINCDEVDCTTLVEYVLAESLSPRQADGDVLESDFADKLQQIRYRNGKIDGYASRLHYVADWINNGVRNGFLLDVTAQQSNYCAPLTLSYMSSHPQMYHQLAASAQNVTAIRQVEQALNGQSVCYLPKEQLPVKGLPWIKDGDIIAITTSTEGLDVAHMGIAIYVNGRLTLLHASSVEKKVVVSSVALSQMLNVHDTWTGIRVIRMM